MELVLSITECYYTKMKITQQEALERLAYDPTTGILRWKKPHSNRIKIGAIAGYRDERGYQRVHFGQNRHYAHQIIWLMMTGEWPFEIDHRDLDRSNNSWSNLRKCERSENRGNQRVSRSNKLGIKGVSFINDHYRAKPYVMQIRRDGKKIREWFATAAEAKAAYNKHSVRIFGEFARP